MDTNLFGVINGIASFLPVVQGQDHHTAIVITGSKQGITNPPGKYVRLLFFSLSLSLFLTHT